ncbi:MAG: hypothetical protein GY856_21125 [bacterium]|nr:hypothetical protein [bacterium]
MPTLTGLILAVSLAAGASPSIEILTPVDGSLSRVPVAAIVVRPNSPALEVTLNGKPVEPFSPNEEYKDFAHGYLDLEFGENLLTVSLGEEQRTARIERRPYYAAVRKKDRKDFEVFHVAEREAPCGDCHSMEVDESTRNPRRSGDSICTSCHQAKLDMKYVHGPLGTYVCMACHVEEPSGTLPKYSVTRKGPELCNTCHETKRAIGEYRYVHGPLAVGFCKVCHDPHGSPYKLLLHNENKELCYSCHVELRETVEDAAAIRHGIIDAEGCTACHEPHGEEQPFLLRQPLQDLCLSCHEEGLGVFLKRKMHPVRGHPVEGVPDPLHPGKDLNCISCHNPHASKAPGLLRGPSYIELCQGCHHK